MTETRPPFDIMKTGIFEAQRRAGGVTALSRKLKVSRAVVYAWLNQGYVPIKRAKEIEELLGVPRMSLMDPLLRDLVSGR